MQNPMLAAGNRQKLLSNLKQIKDQINGISVYKNPQMALNHLLSRNPGFKQAMDYVNANGGDPKEALNKLLTENGIDPAEVMSALK